MRMAFLSRGFKNLQWYGMTKSSEAVLASELFLLLDKAVFM